MARPTRFAAVGVAIFFAASARLLRRGQISSKWSQSATCSRSSRASLLWRKKSPLIKLLQRRMVHDHSQTTELKHLIAIAEVKACGPKMAPILDYNQMLMRKPATWLRSGPKTYHGGAKRRQARWRKAQAAGAKVKVEDKELTALPTPKRGTITVAERHAIRAIQEKWPNWEPPEKGDYTRNTFSRGAGHVVFSALPAKDRTAYRGDFSEPNCRLYRWL